MNIKYSIQILVTATFLSGIVSAQTGRVEDIAVSGGRVEIGVLKASENSKDFLVSSYVSAGSVLFSVQSQAKLDIELIDPSGTTLADVTLDQAPYPLDPFGMMLPTSTGGFEWSILIPNSSAGDYVIRASHGAMQEDSLVIVSSEVEDPSIVSGLVALSNRRNGNLVPLSMIVYENGVACQGGSVVAHVLDPNRQVTTLQLYDNGEESDAVTGDGIYSGIYQVLIDGEHSAVAQFAGTTPSGLAISGLKSSTTFDGSSLDVVPPATPIAFHEMPWGCMTIIQDDDSDGYYEGISLEVSFDLMSDIKGLDYTIDASVDILSSGLNPSILASLSLSKQYAAEIGGNMARIALPMTTLSTVGDTGVISVNIISISSDDYPSLPPVQVNNVGVVSQSIDFDQFEHCPADINLDWIVDNYDFTAWIAAYNTQSPIADVNQDGDITPADFTDWIAHYNEGC